MNDPVLYAKSNTFQKVTAQKILSEFSHLFQWREDGSILDIDCGTGDATVESILPLLPTKSNRLIGCDISSEMIDYAQKQNSHPNVTFQQLDIGGDVDDFLMKFGPFDHAISSFCLHWVRDQYAAMKNISKLLSAHDCNVMLQTVGFADCDIQERESRYLYDNYDDFVNFVRSMNPFVKRIPASEQQDFVTDYAKRTMLKNKEISGTEYLDVASIFVAYARK